MPKMKLSLIHILAFLPIIFSCHNANKIIEIKNEQGQLIQKIFGDTSSGINGKVELYDPEGRVKEIAYYQNGKLEGERQMFEQGKLYSVEHRKNDNYEGSYIVFHANGNKIVEGQYENNVTVGIWKSFYPSGKIKDEVMMKDNAENGPFKEYYENGTIKAVGNYKEGMNEQDSLKLYDSLGLHIRTMICEMGICQTIWKKDSIISKQ